MTSEFRQRSIDSIVVSVPRCFPEFSGSYQLSPDWLVCFSALSLNFPVLITWNQRRQGVHLPFLSHGTLGSLLVSSSINKDTSETVWCFIHTKVESCWCYCCGGHRHGALTVPLVSVSGATQSTGDRGCWSCLISEIFMLSCMNHLTTAVTKWYFSLVVSEVIRGLCDSSSPQHESFWKAF